MPDGTELLLSQVDGLVQVKDLNSNVMTIGREGITSSTGLNVPFKRDADGRITSITDPEGAVMSYAYNADGDLVGYTDREENTTTFTYLTAPAHHLDAIKDPLGRTPIRNEYYPDGRIKSHTDAFGKTIQYAHNVGGRQEIVTDRNGKTRLFEYDDRGNVTREVDQEGKQVLRTFDARNNRKSETLPHDQGTADPPKTTYEFDDVDNLLSTTDPENNTTSYTYNERRQVLTVKDARDKTTTNTYDAKGNLETTKDALDNVTTYTYNAAGNLLTQTQTVAGVAQTMRYEYDARGNPTKEIDAHDHATTYTVDRNGNRRTQTTTRTTPSGLEALTTTHEYDANGRLTKTIDPDTTFTRTIYDALGRQKETRDKLDRATTFDYDAMGRLTKTTYPDSTFDESTYDNEGRRLTSRDRGGRVTTYEYDGLGRLKKTIFPADPGQTAPFTENVYDAAGRLSQTIDARGKSTFYEYDDAGRRTKVRAPIGTGLFAESVFTYDANGNQKTFKDPNGHTYTYEYDDLNRRTKTIFPDQDQTFTQTTYDDLGRRIAERDQAGKVTRFEYDKLGRLTKVIDALDHETTYTYDELGNRLTQTDANNHTTRFEYDKLGRQTARILPDNALETMTYDAAGNMETKVDFMARTITYDYDINNRLESRSYPNAAENVSFTYTATGRRETATDARGVTSYTYDVRDRVKTMTYPDGRGLSYDWDANGNRSTLTALVGTQSLPTTYTYDDGSRLSDVVDPLSRTSHYDYDPNGNRTGLTQPNAAQTQYTYNTINRLTDLDTMNAGATIQRYQFTLGPAGNRERIDEAGGLARIYSYDDLYRLIGEQVTGGALPYTKTFEYDNVGNRERQTSVGTGTPTVDYDYDTRDRLLTEGSQAHTWDTNGNLTSKDAEATYTWDTENRLVRVNKANGDVVTHAYDVDGNRVQTTTTVAGTTTTTNYLVDTSGGLSHVVAETDATSGLQALYVRGADDLLSVMRPNGSGWTTRYYHADGIGSIRALTDEAGNVTDTYTYTAFGEQLSHTGTDPQPYAFAGEPYDPNSGFQYHRARWMDPRVGRFASMDPWAGTRFEPATLHRYLYAAASPIDSVDPSGLHTLSNLAATMTFMVTVLAMHLPKLTSVLYTVAEVLSPVELGISPGAIGVGQLRKAVKQGGTPVLQQLLNTWRLWRARGGTRVTGEAFEQFIGKLLKPGARHHVGISNGVETGKKTGAAIPDWVDDAAQQII
jgi:RHS repeat-associated protein